MNLHHHPCLASPALPIPVAKPHEQAAGLWETDQKAQNLTTPIDHLPPMRTRLPPPGPNRSGLTDTGSLALPTGHSLTTDHSASCHGQSNVAEQARGFSLMVSKERVSTPPSLVLAHEAPDTASVLLLRPSHLPALNLIMALLASVKKLPAKPLSPPACPAAAMTYKYTCFASLILWRPPRIIHPRSHRNNHPGRHWTATGPGLPACEKKTLSLPHDPFD